MSKAKLIALLLYKFSKNSAILSLISIIAATYKGVEYLMSNSGKIVEKIVEVRDF